MGETQNEIGYFSQGIGPNGPVLLEDGQPISIERAIYLLNQHASLMQLVAQHDHYLETHPYAYFELAYTRTCGWMAWITSHPSEQNPQRLILAKGQGSTPAEACQDALESTPLQCTRRVWTVCYRDETGYHHTDPVAASAKQAANAVAAAGLDREILFVFMGDLKDWRAA